jgi:outer membrane protein OmpA-like peptidoglycan-associated protein
MKSRYLLGAGVALAVAFGCAEANAQFAFLGGPYPVAFYIGPEGGFTSLSQQQDNATTPPFTVNNSAVINGFNFRTNYNSGFNAGARGGIQWGPIRVEEEYSYRHNGLSGFGPNGNGNNILFTGNRNTNSIMTNFIYDFALGWPVTPHIGFGIGAVENNDSVTLNTFTTSPGTSLAFRTPANTPGGPTFAFIGPGATLGGTFLRSSSNWQFGYQAIAGIRYDINPLLAFDLDYRYLATSNNTVNNKGVLPFPPAGFPPGTTRYRTGYNTQNLVASLTLKFGAPPPAPPPPAPPAPPPPTRQVYLVFFDWDKYNITPEGNQILQLAANQYKSGGSVKLQVTGFTDLSGPAGYNQRLSERRANAVAVALERLGVARSDMVVTGRGMNDPRVPTALGVREPQNRRVEIVFP